MDGLEGRVGFVTGAGRGIGEAIARRLVAEGVRVAVTDVDAKTAAATAESLGSAALGVQVDITDPASIAAGIAATEQGLGPIDILVNNAGWDDAMPFLDTPLELWDKLIAINYKGPLHCCHAIVPGMIERGYGRVVSVASDAGRGGSGGEAVYSGCKGGIIAFSKSLARETARSGVSVNCVCPGPTETQLFHDTVAERPRMREAFLRAVPMRRFGEPEDLAGAVAFLASKDADYITGQTLSVSGGLTMM
jgi:2-hydroxycyclohexanecarboxyl-CoA dehydrogenase